MALEPTFAPDAGQRRVLEHTAGALLLTGPAGSGKTAVLRERFARLIEDGQDPERIALVVGSRRARLEARAALLRRLHTSLPSLKVLTVHALAYSVMAALYATLDYDQPPAILSAADQFAKVRELLQAEDPGRWPAYGGLLSMRGFADQVRQFLLRAQESQIEPEVVGEAAADAHLTGWRELADFYRHYLDDLGELGMVDFAGLVWQASVAADKGPPLFDHLLVDDYQDTTVGAESLLASLRAPDVVVAGDAASHVFSFQGTTDRPLDRFTERFPAAERVELGTNHRTTGVALEAWCAPHTSEECAAVAREVRRIHVEEGVPWARIAVVVRRQDDRLTGVVRALKDAGVPASVPESGTTLSSDAVIYPFVLAMRWLAHPADRDALVETVLTSELAGLSPAAARGAMRQSLAATGSPMGALTDPQGLTQEEAASVAALHGVLREAEAVAERSVLDAFKLLWNGLAYAHRLVEASEDVAADASALAVVNAFADAVARAEDSADPSADAFVTALEPGAGGPGVAGDARAPDDAVPVLTAHAAAGREFDTVVLCGTVEGDFPSLTRPEPMFDLDALRGSLTRSARNRLRLEDERRLFRMVAARAVRRVLFTASDPHGEDTVLTARSRFVDELEVPWARTPPPTAERPVSVGEADALWRRVLADHGAPADARLSALDGLMALGATPARWWFQRDWTGLDRPLHEGVRVSASRLETLENCPLQFVLREELGLARPAGYHAWVGKLVHRLIEDCENGLVPKTPQALVAEADRRWQPGQFPSLAVSEAFRKLVIEQMLPNWFDHYAKEPALSSEIGFGFEFEGAKVTGRIDRIGPIVAGGNKVTDFKTGKPDRAGNAEESLQLGVYYLAAHEAEELSAYRPVRGVELAFLRGHWRTGELERRAWMVGENSKQDEEYQARVRERLAGLIAEVRELYETERYRPSTSAECFGCDFKTLCPLWPEGRPLFPVEAGP